MKKIYLSSFLLASVITTQAQMRTAYAITGQANGTYFWSDIREIDLKTGSVTNVVFENAKTKYIATSKEAKQINAQVQADQPMYAGVAAAAFDKKTNKLFFTPMHSAQLRFMDMGDKNASFTYVVNLLDTKGQIVDEANQFTRMAISADGMGYAISNNGDHLVQFSTGKKIVTKDLGAITDAPGNTVSFAVRCTSWGGDMVADAYGNLWVVSAKQHMFLLNTETLQAEYKGQIKNLPNSYTTNAMAVDENGKLVLGSANVFEGFYTLDPKTLEATKIETKGQVFNTSDFANSNLLFQAEADAAARAGSRDFVKQKTVISNDFVTVYPNPVTDGAFKIDFSKVAVGNYNVTLADVSGRAISTNKVSVALKGQIEMIRLPKVAAGIYSIKILDEKGTSILSSKLLVQ